MDHEDEVALQGITENVRDQDELERDITAQANRAIIEAEDKRDQRRIEKAEQSLDKLHTQLAAQHRRLVGTVTQSRHRDMVQKEIARLEAEINICHKDRHDSKARIAERHKKSAADELPTAPGGRLPDETQREYLIRTGKITPFAKIGGPKPEGVEGPLADAIIEAEDDAAVDEIESKIADGPRSHQNLRLPGFSEDSDRSETVKSEFSLRPRKRRRPRNDEDSADEFVPDESTEAATPSSLLSDESDGFDMTDLSPKPKKKKAKTTDGKIDLSGIDDGNEAIYKERLQDWVERRSRARRHRQEQLGLPVGDDNTIKEWHKPSPDNPDLQLENGLRLPGDIATALFDYQKTGVQWLAELFAQSVGGIVGDEMGLGKTVQLIAFVAALHYSKMLKRPVIIVAPATLLQQWVNEFHRWWPPLRVSILHSSGSGIFNVRSEGEIEDNEEKWDGKRHSSKSTSARQVINRVVKHGHVLVTTYAGLQIYRDILTPIDWDYAVLDEGHKIRNPDAAITIACKELRTFNRVILSGTPMQNNLTELWSLFDFISPMRLGTLVAFRDLFEIPIKLGGYANATNLQIMTAQKCAETLKQTISPYLLQRLKVDVAADLPKKTEQVLFCKLTKEQRQVYEQFLSSEEMNKILDGTRQSFYGIDILRKICNHPDLVDRNARLGDSRNKTLTGAAEKSGKMIVVQSLLRLWKRLGHKTLLFSQGTQMLDILEKFVKNLDGIKYLRMDGKTAIKQRQALVDKFNNDPDLDVFLLTTKVGGLGVNLTGANRVIIFDPDWNPSTDVQARERAWRLGQKKEVTIYRLMTAGTIEEKIYQRQIFKQVLSNKVLKDPKQRTNFKLQDLHNLFTLSSYEDGVTETSEIFQGSEVKSSSSAGPRMVIQPGRDNDPYLAHRPKPSEDPKTSSSDDKAETLGSIDGVASIEEFRDDAEKPSNEEDRLMEGIFAKSGVHSALEHDKVIGNGKKHIVADQRMLQHEANRIAGQAATGLRRAAEAARDLPVGTVTWTGEFGDGGRPINLRRARGGPSSASVLASVANRQGFTTGSFTTNRPRPGAASSSSSELTVEDFEKMIPKFIMRHGGQVPSKLMVDHFNQYCDNARMVAVFKKALDNVAMMEQRGTSLRSLWVIRPEHR